MTRRLRPGSCSIQSAPPCSHIRARTGPANPRHPPQLPPHGRAQGRLAVRPRRARHQSHGPRGQVDRVGHGLPHRTLDQAGNHRRHARQLARRDALLDRREARGHPNRGPRAQAQVHPGGPQLVLVHEQCRDVSVGVSLGEYDGDSEGGGAGFPECSFGTGATAQCSQSCAVSTPPQSLLASQR